MIFHHHAIRFVGIHRHGMLACIVVVAAGMATAAGSQGHGSDAGLNTGEVIAQPVFSDGWPRMHEALDLLASLAMDAAVAEEGQRLPLFETVYNEWFREQEGEAAHSRAIAALERLEAIEFFASLDDLGRTRNFEPPLEAGVHWEFRRLGDMRHAARACAARMHLAAQRGDIQLAVQSFEHLLMLGRAGMTLPDTISHLVGIAIASLAEERARALLFERELEPRHVRAMLEAIERQSGFRPIEVIVAGEAQWFRNELPGFFDADGQPDPDRTKLGEWGLEVPRAQRLADRDQTEAFVEARLGRVLEAAQRPIWEALPALEAIHQEAIPPELAIAGLMPRWSRTLQTKAVMQARRRGLRQMLALELYRAERSSYPKALTNLIPEYLPALPLDPFTGEHFVYRVQDAEEDLHGRGYLLYSVGPDRVDDGGQGHPAGVYTAGRARTGVDLIINERPSQ